MISKMIEGLGRNARFAVSVLTLIVAANVLLQLYTHKTTALTAWKGGGFGMYTEPHGEDRSVWIELTGQNGTAPVRLWPPTVEYTQWREKAGVSGRRFLDTFQNNAERMRFFPRYSNATDLVSRAARVRWPETLVGEVVPREGRVFGKSAVRLIVYENRYNISEQKVVRRQIFEQVGGSL